MNWNTDYAMRRPELKELPPVFGSFRRALAITVGDIKLLCLYLANPLLIATASDVQPLACDYKKDLELAAHSEACAEAWDSQDKAKKRSIAHVMRETGFGRVYAKRILVKLGRIRPAAKQACEHHARARE